jgi:tRNA 2-thiouridine synthesizing protein E
MELVMTVAQHKTSLELRLGAIERKLDRVLAQQDSIAELAEGMMPVAKSMLRVGTAEFEDLERRGYFAAGRRVLQIIDKVVATYGEDDLQALGDNIVAILDTVRDVTQPDVLEVVNDASDAIHHADDVERLGRMGLLRSTGDEDVQRGLTLAVEVFRRIGRAQSKAPTRPRKSAPASSPPTVRARVVSAKTDLAPAPEKPIVSGAERPTTTWEGVEFYEDGFLVDPRTWTPALGEKIASGLGVHFGDTERKVVEWARAEFQDKGASPNVRRMATGSGVGTGALYAMFPQTPGKKIAMIAGIPKPVGCI